MSPHITQADHVPPQPWKNGRGHTRELLAWPSATDWQVRISLADVASDGPFSQFPGVMRWFALTEGDGVTLSFPDSVAHLRPSHAPLVFDGAHPPTCHLTHGPTRDLNLMVRHGEGWMQRVEAHPHWSHHAVQRGLFCAVPGTWRSATGRTATLPARSLLWITSADAGAFSFTPHTGPAPGHPTGWWLAFTPASQATLKNPSQGSADREGLAPRCLPEGTRPHTGASA